jgi:hypothetical protein
MINSKLTEASSLNKVQKLMQLTLQWFNYLKNHPERKIAIDDLNLWLATTFFKKNMLKAGIPWINFPAQRWLQTKLSQDSLVFEWGSGASSVYFAKRVKELTSIEYDKQWFEIVENEFINQGFRNGQLKFFGANDLSEFDPFPDNIHYYQSEDKGYKNKIFYSYVRSILNYPDSYFDLILVDGRARGGCLKMAMTKIKQGGIILLDNSEREEYLSALNYFVKPGWKIQHFWGPGPSAIWPVFWRTTAFIKN